MKLSVYYADGQVCAKTKMIQSQLIIRKLGVCAICVGLGFFIPASAAEAVDLPPSSPITQPVYMCGSAGAAQASRPLFESVPSRPLALSDDGSLLFAVNTQANCLEIFDVRGKKIKLLSTVSVGVDPVAVAVRSPTEVWVVNHASDSVSIVDIRGTPHVKETLQVGDEPWDIVFADNQIQMPASGARQNRRNRAYISAAYRGQFHPQFKAPYLYQGKLDGVKGKPGEDIGRADLWVLDINQEGRPRPSGIINLFTSSVRSLAVSTDGSRVFAASFKSGNRTAAIVVNFDDLLSAKWSSDGVGNPEPVLMVQQNNGKLVDEYGRPWNNGPNLDIADNDLFVIDASKKVSMGDAEHPIFNRSAIVKTIENVGTILFNVAANDDYIFVSGIDSHNMITLENKLKGRFVTNFVASIDIRNNFRVNTIPLDNLKLTSVSGASNNVSAALPAGMAVMDQTLLLTAMGGQNILSFKINNKDKTKMAGTVSEENISFQGRRENKDGPLAVEVDKKRGRFFIYTGFDNSISVYESNDATDTPVDHYVMLNGESDDKKQGRRFFYDAVLTSENGNVACASCHIFGGTDKLQWDLGRPDKPIESVQLPYMAHPDPTMRDLKTTLRTMELNIDPDTVAVGDAIPLGNTKVPFLFRGAKQLFADQLDQGKINLATPGLAYLEDSSDEPRLSKFFMHKANNAWVLIDTPFFHPLKGPMLTLPLYGIADSGPMHFRGDIQGQTRQGDNRCPKGQTVEERALKEFNSPCEGGPGTFESLLGGKKLDDVKMQQLTDFLLSLTYPPNPIRPLDNNYANTRGADLFFNQKTLSDVTDADRLLYREPLVFSCQECHLVDRKHKKFGTSTLMYSAPVLSKQDAKIPHLRFLYDRVGYFPNDREKKGKTINAAGFNHGGTLDMSMFFFRLVWILDKDAYDPLQLDQNPSQNNYVALFEFLMGFDTNLFPMYGRQITMPLPKAKDANSLYREFSSFDTLTQYIENAYSPFYADTPQCAVHMNIIKRNGVVESKLMEPGQVLDGHRVSRNKVLDFLVSIGAETDMPATLTCL